MADKCTKTGFRSEDSDIIFNYFKCFFPSKLGLTLEVKHKTQLSASAFKNKILICLVTTA